VPGLLKPHDTQPSDMDSALAKGRHEIRRLRTQLEERTKLAGMMEADRRERIKKLHEKVFSTLKLHISTVFCDNIFIIIFSSVRVLNLLAVGHVVRFDCHAAVVFLIIFVAMFL